MTTITHVLAKYFHYQGEQWIHEFENVIEAEKFTAQMHSFILQSLIKYKMAPMLRTDRTLTKYFCQQIPFQHSCLSVTSVYTIGMW